MSTNITATARITEMTREYTASSRFEISVLYPVRLFRKWKRRVHQRKELRRLLETSHHLIIDYGLGVDEALYEISKPFYVE